MSRTAARVGVALVLTLVLAVTAVVVSAHLPSDAPAGSVAARPRPSRTPESGAPAASAPSSSSRVSSSASTLPAPASRHPRSLAVVALGDSVTAGSTCHCTAFPELYGAGLHTRYGTTALVRNDGENGLTSRDTVTALKSDHAVRADVIGADVVLLTIGANDFGGIHQAIETDTCGRTDHLRCARSLLAALGDNLDAILSHVDTLRGGPPGAVLVTGYWNVYQDGDVADRDFSLQGHDISDQLTRAVNAVVADAAHRWGATYVDLYQPFKGADGRADPTRLLAGDGDHPDAAGHRVIARTLLAAGLPPSLTSRH